MPTPPKPAPAGVVPGPGFPARSRSHPHPLDRGHPPSWASAWGEDRFGVFTAFTVGDVEQRLRWIEPGSFWMGSPESEEGRFHWEFRHRALLPSGFWLSDTPCAQALWEAVMDANPSHTQAPDHPVERVSWEDCQGFLRRLEDRAPGLGARLPTETEWEYSCRAGTTTATWAGDVFLDGRSQPWLDEIAWHKASSPHGTQPVALKRPNPWGLYDMLGNVYEWCEDLYASYSGSEDKAPHGVKASRVIRGGSWRDEAQRMRAASRRRAVPSTRWRTLGFRIACNDSKNRRSA